MKLTLFSMRFGGLASLLAFLIVVSCVPGFSAEPASVADRAGRDAPVPSLALLDPVDLAEGVPSERYGDFMRNVLERTARFQVIPRADMEKKLREFDWNKSLPCHEFQCGFDAGNVLLSEYVLFGTLTATNGVFAYTFNILHVPTGQVVVSEVGDVPGKSGDGGDEPLKVRLDAFLSGLDPDRLDKSKTVSRGLMAVVDLSPESPESRILAERVGTHAHASRRFDLMSQLELKELVTAIGIPLSTIETNDSGMLALGSRLNVAYLVHSRLHREAKGMRLDLALFDVTAKRRIRDWPSKPTPDFQDILHLENRFFTTLTGLKPDAPGAGRSPARGGYRSRLVRSALTAAGLSATAGLAALAYLSHREANGAYAEAERSMSEATGMKWRRRTEEKDRRALIYGSFAALSLGATIALWTF